MTEDIFKNYEAFYNMLLGTTMLSNSLCEQYETDAGKIIDFIGKAYGLKSKLTDECRDVILKTLSKLGKITDRDAVYGMRKISEHNTYESALLDIKCDVLTEIQNMSKVSSGKSEPGLFDYSHYKVYRPEIAYKQTEIAAASGNLIATRQMGILSALGIGCKADLTYSALRLTQCAFWGDIPSMKFLSYIYKQSDNQEKSTLFTELSTLSDLHLRAGCTVIPESERDNYSEKARTYYAYISTIYQDIVHALDIKKINFSFIEAITSDNIDYYQRMSYINNYKDHAWKEVTNSSVRPSKPLGFK